jgi:cell division septation protein DedD
MRFAEEVVPTIEEAVHAAQSLTFDLEQQVAIAAGLMGTAPEEVRERVRLQPAEPMPQSSLPSGRMRSVVVEHRAEPQDRSAPAGPPACDADDGADPHEPGHSASLPPRSFKGFWEGKEARGVIRGGERGLNAYVAARPCPGFTSAASTSATIYPVSHNRLDGRSSQSPKTEGIIGALEVPAPPRFDGFSGE